MTVVESLNVYCADVGSLAEGNFGWARAPANLDEPGTGSRDIQMLAEGVAEDLLNGRPVALGFECPLYVPLRSEPEELTRKRPGEGRRPWSAGAGANSLTTGLVQARWVVAKIYSLVNEAGVQIEPGVFLDWGSFASHSLGLLLWEAHVSDDEHSGDHVEDAKTGVKTFLEALDFAGDPESMSKDPGDPVLSLIGAVLLRVGWSDDTALLAKPCLRLVAQDVVP